MAKRKTPGRVRPRTAKRTSGHGDRVGRKAAETPKKRGQRPAGARSSRVGRQKTPADRIHFHAELTLSVFDGASTDRVAVKLRGRASGLGLTARRAAAAGRVRESIDADSAARLLGSLSHPQRIIILTTLLESEATHQALVRATGLKAGPLYHHLRDLREQGLIGPKTRDLYVLTRRGQRAVLAAATITEACDRAT